MLAEKIKSRYQESKSNQGGLSDERLRLGRREIHTLKELASHVGYATSLRLKVLDLGCGDRYIAPACAEEGWDYEGLDYDCVDFESDALPCEAESVDIAMSLAVIEHLREPDQFISEIFRCLRPGGLVYLSTPNFQRDYKNFYNDPTHVRPYTPQSIAELLRLFGFSNIDVFPGIRAKPRHWYTGKLRFFKAYYMLPFRADTKWPVPDVFKGHARSMFAVGMKPRIQ